MDASWGRDEREVIDTVEQLDLLLDRVDADARHSGLPQVVQLTDDLAGGTLGVVVGGDRSLLNHVPADGNPPYLTSRGDEEEDKVFTFYVAGDNHSESHWRHTIAIGAAREAARVFLRTGVLDNRVSWDEV